MPGAGEGGDFLVKFDDVEMAQVNATVTFFISALPVGGGFACDFAQGEPLAGPPVDGGLVFF